MCPARRHYATAGLPPFIDEAHKKNMMRNNLLRLVTVFVVIIFVWTSQSRITRYRWLLFKYLHIYTHTYISTMIYLQEATQPVLLPLL